MGPNTIVCLARSDLRSVLTVLVAVSGSILKLTPIASPSVPSSANNTNAVNEQPEETRMNFSPWMQTGYYLDSGNSSFQDKEKWFDNPYSTEIVHVTR
jgi:hypothetical protein